MVKAKKAKIKKAVKKTSVVKKAKKTLKRVAKKVVRKVGKTGEKVVSVLTLRKHHNNPIIGPRKEIAWEAWQTFNPGVILLEKNVHFLYRAIGEDGLSRLGYAFSKDGFNVNQRFPIPAYEHQIRERTFNVYSYCSGGSWGGAEDPRIVRVGKEDVLYMTYTACNGDLRVGLTSIRMEDFLKRKWKKWKPPVLISQPGEVHKNWVIFPEKINGKYAILHSINPGISVAYLDSLDLDGNTFIESCHGGKPRTGCWDKWVRGAGAVPIKTKYGWLVFYHAMDNDWSKYKVGAMLLDLNDPTKVLARATEPVLEPSEEYENNGFKPGVVYVSGAVVKDGQLLVYYGGADSYVCVAHADFNEFLEALKNENKPKLTGGEMKMK
ncbi:MAG: glycosidase [Candidatus Liptonbacteria bacterium]|nr:glycosidase [Candidatus Liptonbacteria bacterium]